MIGKIQPQLAAAVMGVTPSFIYIGLQRGLLPFGTAIKKRQGRGAKCSYYISPKLFMDYTGVTEAEIKKVAEERGMCIAAAAGEADLMRGIEAIERMAECPDEKVI